MCFSIFFCLSYKNSSFVVLTHWFLANLHAILIMQISIVFHWLIFSSCFMIMPTMNATVPYLWYVNTGSANGFVSSGNKILPELMLTQFSLSPHYVTRSECVNLVICRCQDWTPVILLYVIVGASGDILIFGDIIRIMALAQYHPLIKQ